MFSCTYAAKIRNSFNTNRKFPDSIFNILQLKGVKYVNKRLNFSAILPWKRNWMPNGLLVSSTQKLSKERWVDSYVLFFPISITKYWKLRKVLQLLLWCLYSPWQWCSLQVAIRGISATVSEHPAGNVVPWVHIFYAIIIKLCSLNAYILHNHGKTLFPESIYSTKSW